MLVNGEPEAALVAIEQERAEFFRLMGLAMYHHTVGQTTESDAVIDELIESNSVTVNAYNIAQVFAFRGDVDRAFEWLDIAVQTEPRVLQSEITLSPGQ